MFQKEAASKKKGFKHKNMGIKKRLKYKNGFKHQKKRKKRHERVSQKAIKDKQTNTCSKKRIKTQEIALNI